MRNRYHAKFVAACKFRLQTQALSLEAKHASSLKESFTASVPSLEEQKGKDFLNFVKLSSFGKTNSQIVDVLWRFEQNKLLTPPPPAFLLVLLGPNVFNARQNRLTRTYVPCTLDSLTTDVNFAPLDLCSLTVTDLGNVQNSGPFVDSVSSREQKRVTIKAWSLSK